MTRAREITTTPATVSKPPKICIESGRLLNIKYEAIITKNERLVLKMDQVETFNLARALYPAKAEITGPIRAPMAIYIIVAIPISRE